MTDIHDRVAAALSGLGFYDYETNDLVLRGTHRDAAQALLAALAADGLTVTTTERAAIGEAVERLIDATRDDSGLAILNVPAGERWDGRTLADREGWTIERWTTVWGHDAYSAPTLPEAIDAALRGTER